MTHDQPDDDVGELPERSVDEILRLADFEEIARARMDPAAYAYYAGGAADESTMADNVAGFARLRLRPRVLRDVSHVNPSTTLLGRCVPWAFGLAPNAAQVLAHPDGECASARAAASAGIVMCVSTFSNKPIEEVSAAAPGGHRWFQLYVHQEREVAEEMIDRAVAAGYEAIVVTVDLPVAGYRERELRQPYRWSEETAFGNLGASSKGKEILELLGGLVNAALTWDDLSWIREVAGLPVVVKGILTGEDAALAVEHGAAGVWVSNHGGRQLDNVTATIDALPEVLEAIGGRVPVLMDGGIRRGTDIAVALALGADAVLVGRAPLWGLAADGQAGAQLALEILGRELRLTLAVLGAASVSELDRSHVGRRARY